MDNRKMIYLDDAINALERKKDKKAKGDISWFYNKIIQNDIDTLMQLSAAQPEIIRCKDCKHYQFADNRAFGMPVKMCKWFGFEDVDDNDFCSRAERSC